MPSRCLIMGMRDSRESRSISSLPPRGTTMSTYSRSVMSSPTAARSVVSTSWTEASGSPALFNPARTHAAMARFEPSTSDPPRRMAAVPDFSHTPAGPGATGGAGGVVGPRLVDDGAPPERNAHARHLDPGRPLHALRDRADRIGQLRHLLEPLGHLLHELRRERGAVDEGRVVPFGVRDVGAVRVEDRVPARADLAGYGAKGPVLLLGAGARPRSP